LGRALGQTAEGKMTLKMSLEEAKARSVDFMRLGYH
jgi:hypothetical protein